MRQRSLTIQGVALVLSWDLTKSAVKCKPPGQSSRAGTPLLARAAGVAADDDDADTIVDVDVDVTDATSWSKVVPKVCNRSSKVVVAYAGRSKVGGGGGGDGGGGTAMAMHESRMSTYAQRIIVEESTSTFDETPHPLTIHCTAVKLGVTREKLRVSLNLLKNRERNYLNSSD